MLNNFQIQEFSKLWKDHFGEELSEKEAIEKGLSLIQIVKIVYQSSYGKGIENK